MVRNRRNSLVTAVLYMDAVFKPIRGHERHSVTSRQSGLKSILGTGFRKPANGWEKPCDTARHAGLLWTRRRIVGPFSHPSRQTQF